MQPKYSSEQLSKIIDQSLVYQCACPAQVCNALIEMRELYDYQINCLDQTDVDQQVHKTIAQATIVAHNALEVCLETVLKLEGWDTRTLLMPENLKKKPAKPF